MERSRTRLFYRLGVALLVLATFGVFAVARVEPAQAQSTSLYKKLQEAAAQGNGWAQGTLTQVDDLLKRQGKASPPVETKVGRSDSANGIRIFLKGQEPFYLKVYNYQEFSTPGEIDAYVTKRRAALAQLARQDANRQIEVSISPREYMALSDVWRLKQENGLDIDQMTVNIFVDGRWHSVMSVGDPKDPGELPLVDFTASVQVVENSLRNLVPTRAFSQGGARAEAFELKVSWLRGKMQAASALRLGSLPSTLVVDPISDLLDAYRGRAVQIEVVDMPQLLDKKNNLRASNPTATKPTPAPLKEKK